jgi:hypothetical protein
MIGFGNRFATTLSGFCAVLVLSACGDTGLQGTVHCQSAGETCASGELCRDQVFGAADDAGVELGCVKVPSSCAVRDCSGSGCPSCIMKLCDPPYDHDPRLQGRLLECNF